jgi:hypothetical protein
MNDTTLKQIAARSDPTAPLSNGLTFDEEARLNKSPEDEAPQPPPSPQPDKKAPPRSARGKWQIANRGDVQHRAVPITTQGGHHAAAVAIVDAELDAVIPRAARSIPICAIRSYAPLRTPYRDTRSAPASSRASAPVRSANFSARPSSNAAPGSRDGRARTAASGGKRRRRVSYAVLRHR